MSRLFRYAPGAAAAALSSLFVVSAAAAAATTSLPSVIAMNQKPKGGEVSITYANLPKDGYLVIHPSLKNGKPNEQVLGQISLAAGDHRHVKVKLEGKTVPGEKLWAELQQKPGAQGATQPFTDSGAPARQSFMIQ